MPIVRSKSDICDLCHFVSTVVSHSTRHLGVLCNSEPVVYITMTSHLRYVDSNPRQLDCMINMFFFSLTTKSIKVQSNGPLCWESTNAGNVECFPCHKVIVTYVLISRSNLLNSPYSTPIDNLTIYFLVMQLTIWTIIIRQTRTSRWTHVVVASSTYNDSSGTSSVYKYWSDL